MPDNASRSIEDLDSVSDDVEQPFLPSNDVTNSEKSTQTSALSTPVIENFSLAIFTTIQVFNPILVRMAHKEASRNGLAFLGSTTVFATEIVKIIICCLIIPIRHGSVKSLLVLIWRSFTVNKMETLKVCTPALIYVIQNNLYIFALERIDATIFSLTYQLRILTTALLMMIILNRRFSHLQWMALILSLIGAITVQLGSTNSRSDEHKSNAFADKATGLGAVLVMCLTNAFGGVYLEAVFKKSEDDIFLQNIRLSLISLPMAGITMLSDFEVIRRDGFYSGWNYLVWCIVFISAFGGVVVSAVIKYADNIKKSFCQALALGGTAFISVWMGDSIYSVFLLIGVVLTVLSVILYAVAPRKENLRKRVIIYEQKRIEFAASRKA